MKQSGAGFPTCQEPHPQGRSENLSHPQGRLGNLPHRRPLDCAERRARLGRLRHFVESVVGEADVFHVRKTATKIDVGYWLGKRRVWACLLEKDLLLFARGRRPYVERIPLTELHESRYNHVTGQLVLAPIETAAVKALKLPPLAALEILAYIVGQVPQPAKQSVGQVSQPAE